MQWHDSWPVCNVGFPLAVKSENCHWQHSFLIAVSELLHRFGDFDASPSFYFDVYPYDPGDIGSGTPTARWLRVGPPVTPEIFSYDSLTLIPPLNAGVAQCKLRIDSSKKRFNSQGRFVLGRCLGCMAVPILEF